MNNSVARFALMVQGAPHSSQAHFTALNFVEAVYRAGHEVEQVFFHGDGVYVASNLILCPSDEADLKQRWQTLAQDKGFKLLVCSAAASKRGILCEEEASLLDEVKANMASGFAVSGAGHFIAASLSADRLMVFK